LQLADIFQHVHYLFTIAEIILAAEIFSDLVGYVWNKTWK